MGCDIPGLATMRYEWKAQGLAAATLLQYESWLDRLDRALPDGLMGADRDSMAEVLSRLTPSQCSMALRAYRRWLAYAPDGVADATQGMRRPRAVFKPQPTATAGVVDSALLPAWDIARESRDFRRGAVVSLLWSTGMRVGEAQRLVWDDVDLTELLVLIRKSKTGDYRTAVLDERAGAWLAAWRRKGPQGERVFPYQRRQLQRDVLALLPGLPAHSLRRGWAVHSLRSGISQVSVQAVAGWSSGLMCQRYVKALSAELAIDEFRSRRVS